MLHLPRDPENSSARSTDSYQRNLSSLWSCQNDQGKEEEVQIARVGKGAVEVTAKSFKIKGALEVDSISVGGLTLTLTLTSFDQSKNGASAD